MPEIRGGQFTATFVASGNLDGSQFTFVRQLAGVNNDVLTIATTGGLMAGTLQNEPRDNEFARLVSIGYTKVRVANSLGAGLLIMAGNSGFAVQAQSGAYVGGHLVTGATSGALAELNACVPWYMANSL